MKTKGIVFTFALGVACLSPLFLGKAKAAGENEQNEKTPESRLLPMSYEAIQAQKERMSPTLCKVSLFEDQNKKQKVLAVIQEEANSNDQRAIQELKKQLLKRKGLAFEEGQIALNVNCDRNS